MTEADLGKIANWYRRFASDEAHGRSPLYEQLCLAVAEDEEVLAFLAMLPWPKRQPNLLLASYRWLFGVPDDFAAFRRSLLAHRDAVASEMLARATQTNEAGRCAMLLPALARLPQPLALIEVGAAAGLCLQPDRYAYDYGHQRLGPARSSLAPPVLHCAADAPTPLPSALPRIVWRKGIDLNPIDVGDEEAVRWLETLVWPEQGDRLARLRKAIALARLHQVEVQKGDLLTELPRLCSEAPENATLVIFHTAVLCYVQDQVAREQFGEQAMELGDFWLSNEDAEVFPAFAPGDERHPGKHLLAQNGRPLAWTDAHGATIEWIEQPR